MAIKPGASSAKNSAVLKRNRFRAKNAKDAKVNEMRENEIAKIITQAAFDLHKEIGPGLLE